jgi:hypothetical protein
MELSTVKIGVEGKAQHSDEAHQTAFDGLYFRLFKLPVMYKGVVETL